MKMSVLTGLEITARQQTHADNVWPQWELDHTYSGITGDVDVDPIG